MSYKASKQLDTYYNEFNDIDNLKTKSKHKNPNKDNIKITTKKLPADFFRPLTRQANQFQFCHQIKVNGMKTPCFGQQKPQSHSLSLIPKNKHNFDDFVSRIETLPTDKPSDVYQSHPKRNFSRDLYKKQQQYSYRLKAREPATQISHQSTQRRRLKYQKKLTLNDQLQVGKNRNKNICQNRIRLNVKKFFNEQPLENKMQSNEAKRKWKNRTEKLPPLL